MNLLFSKIDLVSRFLTLGTFSGIESDVLYQDQLPKYFTEAIRKIFFKCGVGDYSEGDTENTIGSFNAACFKLNVLAVMAEFYCNISVKVFPNGRTLNSCVLFNFINELNFVEYINEVRVEMCCLEQCM